MASTEDIEARLCAYVDGELDAVERADIERHLADNAQHRRLIDELSRQRDMLRALPRARAPRDVSETLNSQLERSVLLGDDADDEARIVRISHWAQYRAAAALLFLVFGLAAVVYYVLPSSDPTQSEFARLSTSADPILERAAEPSLDADSHGSVLTSSGAPDTEYRPPSAVEARSRAALDDVIREVRAFANAIAAPGRDDADPFGTEQRRPVSNAVVRVVVDAPDAFAAQHQIESYLVNNGIRYTATPMDADMPEPLALGVSQSVHGSRMQRTNVQLGHSQTDDRVAARAPGSMEDRSEADATRELDRVAQAQAPQTHRKYEVRGMTRRDVQTLCDQIAHPSAGAMARVFEDTPGGLMGLNVLHPTPVQMPSMVTTTDGEGLRFQLIPEAPSKASATDGEQVDVLLYVRAEPQSPGIEPAPAAPAETKPEPDRLRADAPDAPIADEPTTQQSTSPADD